MKNSERPCVLAVDDDPVVRQVLHTILSRDYELVLLSSGDDLSGILDGYAPDLVILDVNMPDHNGFDLCRHIRQSSDYNDLPVIFLSSHYEDRDLINGVRSGADYYLPKPFHSHELRRVVSACLAGNVNALYKLGKVRGI
jgi:DNA-binding response OmpR family regulator